MLSLKEMSSPCSSFGNSAFQGDSGGLLPAQAKIAEGWKVLTDLWYPSHHSRPYVVTPWTGMLQGSPDLSAPYNLSCLYLR
jgi:hypothetical protein